MIDRRGLLTWMLSASAAGLWPPASAGAQDEAESPDVRLSLVVDSPPDAPYGPTYFDRTLKVVTDRAELLPGVLVEILAADEKRIIVNLTGVSEPELAVRAITARGWVDIVDPEGETLPPGTAVTTSDSGIPWLTPDGVIVEAPPAPVYQTIINSDDIVEVYTYRDQLDSLTLGFRLNSRAGEVLGDFTSSHTGLPMAIVVDNVVVSAPVVMGTMGDQGIIQGLSEEDIRSLSVQLAAAPLPARVQIERLLIKPDAAAS